MDKTEEILNTQKQDIIELAKVYDIDELENTPAIALYEKLGYTYIGTVDLGLKDLDRAWFKLYEYKL